jgi:hypothetical protein
MEYYNKIEKICSKYYKDFKRKDLTFEQSTIKCIVKEIEQGIEQVDKEQQEIICKYLYERFKRTMTKRYEYLNSDEYKNKFNYYYS